MKMTFRWFGPKDDCITLEQIRQIPGKPGVVGTLYDIPAGEVWPKERIAALKNMVNAAGLSLEVIESVNIHDAIKTGAPDRDRCIENYITTIKHLSEFGIKVICYNFMPVFDWTRSDLFKPLDDGSTALSYEQRVIDKIDPENIAETIAKSSRGFLMPGWEPERMERLKELFAAYKDVSEEKLVANFKYFLTAIMPACEKHQVKMAVHPDDPPWEIFGLPRIVRNAQDVRRLFSLADSPCNGLTLCTGCFGANPDNDIPAMIREFGPRIHFTHVRNVKVHARGDFNEVSHLSSDGSLDVYEIMKAYYETGFSGYIRPDHGRMIWNEQGRPGYGLYDRALGIAYLNGLWEALRKGGSR
jgi:mannonate dehydratase